MTFANTDEEFLQHFETANSTLQRMPIQDAKAEIELHNFANQKERYTQYILKRVKESRGLISSTPAEQNYSSV